MGCFYLSLNLFDSIWFEFRLLSTNLYHSNLKLVIVPQNIANNLFLSNAVVISGDVGDSINI